MVTFYILGFCAVGGVGKGGKYNFYHSGCRGLGNIYSLFFTRNVKLYLILFHF